MTTNRPTSKVLDLTIGQAVTAETWEDPGTFFRGIVEGGSSLRDPDPDVVSVRFIEGPFEDGSTWELTRDMIRPA